MESMNKVETIIDLLVKHKNSVLASLGLCGLGVVALFGYRMYTHRIQLSAHKDFVSALSMYDAPVRSTPSPQGMDRDEIRFASDQEKWESVEKAFREGYELHRGSGIASMFLAYQSEALLNLDKLPEAISVLKQAVSSMTNPIGSYYELKLALMELDSAHEQEQKAGMQKLERMALDHTHHANDQALYHLGLYFWVNNNFDKAKGYWQQFVVKYGSQPETSGQAMFVKSRLDLIAV